MKLTKDNILFFIIKKRFTKKSLDKFNEDLGLTTILDGKEVNCIDYDFDKDKFILTPINDTIQIDIIFEKVPHYMPDMIRISNYAFNDIIKQIEFSNTLVSPNIMCVNDTWVNVYEDVLKSRTKDFALREIKKIQDNIYKESLWDLLHAYFAFYSHKEYKSWNINCESSCDTIK